jgi:hypothetical protein
VKVSIFIYLSSDDVLTSSTEGQTVSLLDIQREYKSEYSALGADERTILANDFKANTQTSRKKIRRPSPRGRIQDFANTVRNMMGLVRCISI